MISRLLLAAPLLAASSAILPAQTVVNRAEVSTLSLMRHIEVLAGDDFEGREPGTAGETRTLAYLTRQMAMLGLEPAGEKAGWYQPVGLVTRKPFGHRAIWSVDDIAIAFEQENAVFIGRAPSETLREAPVFFVGHGLVKNNVDQLAGADLKGAVALILYDSPKVADFPSYADRVAAVTEAGAAAVIGIVSDEIPWSAITGSYAAGQNKLQSEKVPSIQGAMPLAAAARLITDSGTDFGALLADPGPSFRAVRLKPRASLDVSTRLHAYESQNAIGRLRGSGTTGESILFLAHWDHIGICGPEGAADRICNGAVDNASGLAMMLEAARQLGTGKRPVRDILFMATTAEELGLLGAHHFAARPTVPLTSIVAAVNLDTVAVAPAGEPVAIVGRGATALDALIDQTSRELGRAVDADLDANAFIERQDGWALSRAGVPAVMVGGSFSSMETLGAFLSGPYHKPDDDLDRTIELGGAAEDTELLIVLGRKLADPEIYRPAAR